LSADADQFPRLPVLEALAQAWAPRRTKPLGDAALVGCQHLLETTGSLLECLIRKGLLPQRTFVIGKVYSTHEQTAKRLRELGCHIDAGSVAPGYGDHAAAIRSDAASLWRAAEKTIQQEGVRCVIVLDDGGHVWRTVPASVRKHVRAIGIEQTTSGMLWNATKRDGVPIINVALSAAKRRLEAPLICSSVVERLNTVVSLQAPGSVCGVVGLGMIGLTLQQRLAAQGVDALGFDVEAGRLKHIKAHHRCHSIADLLRRATLILGCTGRDAIPVEALEGVVGCKTLASCSSGDIEFRSILQELALREARGERNTAPTLEAFDASRKFSIRVLRSGYPVNFDNSQESVPRHEIQLTRGLLLAAVIQASQLLQCESMVKAGTIMLDPELQAFVVDAWRGATKRQMGENDAAWYAERSRGTRIPSPVPR